MAVIVLIDELLVGPRGVPDNAFPGHTVLVATDPEASRTRAALAEAEVLLTAVRPVSAELLESAPRVRLIGKPGAGLDNIDLEAARSRRVSVCHAPGARGQAVAEYVVWAILELAKRTATGRLGTHSPLDVGGTAVGLVGLGAIGSRVARVAHALGIHVTAATPSRHNPVPEVPVQFVDLGSVHRDVDALVLCMPLTPHTTGLVNSRTLQDMRADAVLVNVARGPCVVTTDLVRSLLAGQLRGAALDVTDPEPLPTCHPLRQLPQVLLTDHVAGRTPQAQRRAIEMLVSDVTAFLAGEPLRHRADGQA